MKPIEGGIDKYELTKQNIEEALRDFVATLNIGDFVSYKANAISALGRRGEFERIAYEVTVKQPVHVAQGFKAISVGQDRYELTDNEFTQAVKSLVVKHGLGEFVSVQVVSKFEPGDSREPFDYGSYSAVHQVHVRRV